ncbi:PAS domain-containing protein [Hoeflea sp. AS60]|uniref:PAS domain-containing protein n=1 Tax=Hoeflea sp. AS60 TaxID=3135780 RepID=UPI00316C78B6
MDKIVTFVSPHAYLLSLADELRTIAEPEAIKETACRRLAQYLKADQVAYAEIDGEFALIERDWSEGRIPSIAGRHRMSDFGPMLEQALATGQAVVVNDVTSDSRTNLHDALAHFTSVSIGSLIDIPLIKNDRLTAVLAIHNRQPSIWTEDQILSATETAERTWAAVEQARAERKLSDTERRFELALSKSPIVVFEQDLDLRYTWIFNPRFGLSFDQMLGKTDAELMDADAAAELTLVKQDCIKTGQPTRKQVPAFAAGQTEAFFDLCVEPRRDETGAVIGIIAAATDVTERVLSDRQMRSAYQSYLRLIENNPFGVYLVDSKFRLVQVSQGTESVFRNVEPLLGRDFAEILRILWPEPMATELIERFRHTLATGEPYRSTDTRGRRGNVDAEEGYDWKIERVALPNGTDGVVCYYYDLSEQHAHKEQIRTLLSEVTHRSKNLLSLVAVIARNTEDGDPRDFRDRLQNRILAVAASHDLLVTGGWQSVSLDQLIRSQLAHFNDLIDSRIILQGQDLAINPSAAQAIGMAVFELSTNAGKYGALSQPEGSVEISWGMSDDTADQRFTLQWIESGGPTVERPSRRGFGSKVTGSLIKASLNANVDLTYNPAGVQWALDCPSKELLAGAGGEMGS